jgi:2'-5' RNA ligase
MQRLLEDNLAASGYKKDKRPFKGHLTLGRFKQRVNPDTIRRALQEFGNFDSEEFPARRVIFYKSDLKPTGAVYSQLQQAVLE